MSAKQESETTEESTYEQVTSFIESMHDRGVEFKQVVIPSEDWPAVKDRAEYVTDERGPSYTGIDGVTLTHDDYLDEPEARLRITGTEDL